MAQNGTPFDLSRAPFRLCRDASPRQAAAEIITCFGAIAGLPEKMLQCSRAAMRVIGLPEADSLFLAADRIARDIDDGTGAGAGNPYHNRQHFCEVLLSALYLSLLAALKPREQAQLLLAALVHDFHHDGNAGGNAPFRLEKQAAEAALPYFEVAGVAQEERARIAVMVLATELSTGVPFAKQCYRHFFQGGAKPQIPAAGGFLELLASDPRLALQAVLLAEADVLPSVGLTVEYGEMSQANLSREMGKPLGAADKLHFIEQIFQDFTVSRFFSPNLDDMKRAMLESNCGRRNSG